MTSAETGDVVQGVKVCADVTDRDWEYGDDWAFESCELTAADGTYTLDFILIGASYKVRFYPPEDEFLNQVYDNHPEGSTPDLVRVETASVTGIDAALQSPARIEGTVTATEDGLPVEEVEACAWSTEFYYVTCDWTEADGSYSIKVWRLGVYEVEFAPRSSGRNLNLQFYDHADRWDEATLLPVALSERITGIDADLGPGGTISGHITQSVVKPWSEEIHVCSIDAASDEIWTCTWSKSGNYALRYLSPGPYNVVFAPEEQFPETEGEYSNGFPTQFWDYTTSLSQASVISLGAGATVTGIDGWLGLPKPVLAAPRAAPPASVAPQTTARRSKCRRGFKKKVARGHARCVKVHRAHRQRGGHHSTR